MVFKRLAFVLLSLLMMANAPSVAGCAMPHDSARAAQMPMDMSGAAHDQIPSSHHEMPCKDATPQCVDGAGCVTLAALPLAETNLRPYDLAATQILPGTVNGRSLSIQPAIPPPIGIL